MTDPPADGYPDKASQPVQRRLDAARLLITMSLLAMASWSLWREQGQAMAGAVIGYVAAYWLPPPRLAAKPIDPPELVQPHG